MLQLNPEFEVFNKKDVSERFWACVIAYPTVLSVNVISWICLFIVEGKYCLIQPPVLLS
jgi:hypothetical protein